ncbi:protein DOG1-like 4 [Spinacia oleracea]|uniref:Protein DOG1-like 4 n=1 Tax=Spinacia oleracea TaxID=3562 RepID=A0A9R0KAE6_SPIOL|nr:protein DOG1-like 4 [Spinacia oleracea]
MMMNFHRFHDSWVEKLNKFTSQLASTPTPRPNSTSDHQHVRQLVDEVVAHYAHYYETKTTAAKTDVLTLFASPWASSLERSLYWVTGFRPTTLFHLVYTESSIRFESHVADILRGRRTGDLGELTPGQLARVSELQCLTVKEENDIGNELGGWQEEVARSEPEWSGLCGNGPDGLDRLLARLGAVVAKADELRMKTIRQVVELLTPQQAAEFLIAAAELQLGIQRWGLHQDRARVVEIKDVDTL